jgi:hypothetical protein
MKLLLHRNVFLRLLAALTMLLFVGDLAADSIADLSDGHCNVQTSHSDPAHEKAPCSHCFCATHIGAVVIADFAIRVGDELFPAASLRSADVATPPRLAAAIEHPPQLA